MPAAVTGRDRSAAIACPIASASCVPDPKPACPTQLNEQLGNVTLDAAIEKYETFRPLCDKDGYPLCGNLNGKVVTTASQFCKALRDKNLQ